MKTIAFIGLGVMGNAMAGHILDAGYRLRIHTRTRAKAENLLARGAAWCESPADCMAGADAGITIVGFPPDVEQVYFGENGLIAAAAAGAYLIDMTTGSPAMAQKIHAAAKARGVLALDAPVSGGDVGAKNATLSIMVGGEPEAFSACLPLLSCMGKAITRAGGPGMGQHTKMANQIAIAGTIAGVCEAIAYARAVGLNEETMLQCISGGAAGSWQLENNGRKILDGDLLPAFFIKHFIKDMDIAASEARQAGISLPVLEQTLAEYRALYKRDRQNGELGTQALIRFYE